MAGRRRRSHLRSIGAAAVALVLAAEVSRLTLAAAYSETRPQLAAKLGPQEPDVLVSAAMAQVGQAAAAGQLPSQFAVDDLHQLGTSAPLKPEPFLVQAAVAEKAGDLLRAERLLIEARRRDPRSVAARYLLADVWLRQNRVIEGLGEMAILARLLRGSALQLVPALAQYAHTPGASGHLRQVLASNPQLKQPLLTALAADPNNLGLITELNGGETNVAGEPAPPWQRRLLSALIEKGDYGEAYALWQRLSGIPASSRPLVFNNDFQRLPAPPPFNWIFASGKAGFAEPDGGKLRVLHYGRDNADLASQVLLLSPGAYRFSAPASGTAASGALAWVLTCLPTGTVLMESPVSTSPPAPPATFEVPTSGCPAQQLELNGRVLDMAQESDLQIAPIGLQRMQP